MDGLWEASFLVGAARKAVSREDIAYVAGCVFRVVELCAHAIHARAGRWLINEKGAVPAAGRLPTAPAGFADRVGALLSALGASPSELAAALDAAAQLVDDTVAACRSDESRPLGPL